MVADSSILGAAGEHYVMSQLLRRGLIAALAPAGLPNADIVVTNKLGERLSAIQVKTRSGKGADGGWHMKAKHEGISSPNLFYCFVDFKMSFSEKPDCWVLPSVLVAEVLSVTHREWLAKPGMRGQAHNDGIMRRLKPCYVSSSGDSTQYQRGWLEPYYEAWQLVTE